MEHISVLDKLSWPFQFLGLQCFSLKNLKGKNPSVFYRIIGTLWIIWAFLFAGLAYSDFKNTNFDKINYLNLVIKFFNFVNYSASIFICVISTYLNHGKLIEFFRNAEKVSNFCFCEFNYKVNFGLMKKSLITSYIFHVAYFTTLLQFLSFFKGTDIFNQIIKPTFWLIIAIYIQMIVMRFNFYVRVVNFLLKTSSDLIREHFLKVKLQDSNIIEKSVNIWKVSSNFYLEKRKVVVLRKIYLLIKEMSDCINSTMGVIIFLRLFMVTTNMIR
jgi:hypothetical protein